MKTLSVIVYPNGKSTISTTFLHFNGENKAAILTIDFSEVDYITGWLKACDLVVSDGTGKIIEGDTASTLLFELTEDVLKVGTLNIQPYAYRVVEGETERVAFRACEVTVSAFSNLSESNTVIPPSLGDQLQAEIDALELEMANKIGSDELALSLLPKMETDGSNSDVIALQFDTDNTTPPNTGQIVYSKDDRTFIGGLNGVMGEFFQEQFYPRTRNSDSVQINDGELVQYDGAIGNSGITKVKRADTTNLALPGAIMGVATENIPVGQEGKITWFGLVRGIQTNGANYGETWVDGDLLYNHPTILGGLSKTKPVAPKLAAFIGIVVHAHSSNGQILVRPLFFPKLGQLSDVSIVNPVNNDVVVYNSTNARYENSSQNANFKITPEGGYAIKVINRTGAPSVKGYAVTTSSAYDNAVQNIVVNIPNPIGIVYESGVADGSPMWVVVSGIAEAYFANNATRGYLARGFITGDSGYVAGQILSEAVPTSPFATDKHFYELGHVLESKGAPGLAKMVLHFN